MGEGEDAGAILKVWQALGIFYLGSSRVLARPRPWHGTVWGAGVLAVALCLASAAYASDTASMAKPRRQQGILTGMPFMANVASRSFVDALGRKVYLSRAPARVISLAPSITEILYAIGRGDRLVGVTPFCDYPPEAKLKPKVGYKIGRAHV